MKDSNNMAQKLTLDLKEYLDEQFRAVKTQSDEKFAGVNKRFDGVDKQIEDLKKNVGSSDGKINRLWMALLVISIVLFIHFGETEANILKIFKFL